MEKSNVRQEFDRVVELAQKELGLRSDIHPLDESEVSVWKLARLHKVATLLAPQILERNQPKILVDEARYVWQMAALRQEYYLKKCQDIVSVAELKGICVAPLKGAVLAQSAYAKKGFRPFRDLDFLICSKQVYAFDSLMKELEFEHQDFQTPLPRAVHNKGNILQATQKGLGEVSYVCGDLYVEAHTRIVPKLLGDFRLDESWQKTHKLSSEDFLIHLMIHATRHHFLFGLRHLLDQVVWLKSAKPDLNLVWEKLEKANLVHLAWPAWKLAAFYFPQDFPAPLKLRLPFVCGYTDRIQNIFPKIPQKSISFSGSPLPFLLMQKNPWKKLFSVTKGSTEQAQYQQGSSEKPWATFFWKLKRPFGLFWRHFPVISRWGVWALFGR